MTNLNRPDFEDRGVDGFRVRRARLAYAAGAKQIGMSLWELPPGEAAYPYHWRVARLAAGGGRRVPVGEQGGHQLWNRGESPARFLSLSSGPSEGHDIVFYPDSGTVGVFAYDRYDLYRRKGAVDYIETDAGGLPALWAIPKGCSEDRVVLCMHGGGFVEGSRWSASAATSLMALGSAAR